MPVYDRIDLAFERGEGAYLFGTDGRRYLDFASGIAVTMFGHNNAHLVKALTEQAGKVWHCSNIFRIPEQERLAERLVAASFADTVFFCNSGAEALEGGIKTIRKYHSAAGNPQKTRIIACEGAFHGRTMATITAGGQKKHTDGFGPLLPGFSHVAFGNLNEMRAAIGDDVAGILVEPVQGEGGIRPGSQDYLTGLRDICDEYGLLLFFDEVQCGSGRTGRLFAHEWSGIAPDLLATAKGMGGGFPVGAVLATEKAASGMKAGAHGSTFGGNQLAMAVGNAVMDLLMEEGFLDRVHKTAGYLRKVLEGVVARYPDVVEEVRGMGMMLGLKCKVTNSDLIAQMRKEGLLAVGSGDNVARLAPPLIVDKAQIDAAAEMIDRACAALGGGDG
jgi:acetylornithine/N-succinyldiaminopimelate aminotransferase